MSRTSTLGDLTDSCKQRIINNLPTDNIIPAEHFSSWFGSPNTSDMMLYDNVVSFVAVPQHSQLDNTGNSQTWSSSQQYATSKNGRLARRAELQEYMRRHGGVTNPLVPGEDQWVAVTNGYQGKDDYIQIGSFNGSDEGHKTGASHLQYFGTRPWWTTLTSANFNVYVFWVRLGQ
jgi:hypothetical protein